LLAAADPMAYHRHCVEARSDARDVGPALIALRGPLRGRLLDLVADTVADGVAAGEMAAAEPREAARAIVTLATTIVEPYREMRRPMPEVIALYQRFARGITRAG